MRRPIKEKYRLLGEGITGGFDPMWSEVREAFFEAVTFIKKMKNNYEILQGITTVTTHA